MTEDITWYWFKRMTARGDTNTLYSDIIHNSESKRDVVRYMVNIEALATFWQLGKIPDYAMLHLFKNYFMDVRKNKHVQAQLEQYKDDKHVWYNIQVAIGWYEGFDDDEPKPKKKGKK